jgi:hypothetical protein
MPPFLSLFSTKAFDLLEGNLKGVLKPLAGYLRLLGVGVVLIIVSSIAWSGGLLMVLLALFFQLGHLGSYVAPALWTALASSLVGLLFLTWGIILVRRPL